MFLKQIPLFLLKYYKFINYPIYLFTNSEDRCLVIYVHRNTLLYRLGRVKEITGLDPKKFDDAVQLRLALKMRIYQGSNKFK